MSENRIEFCSAVGGGSVVVHPPKEASGLDRSIQALEAAKPFCGDLGIALVIENYFPGDHEMLARYFERFPPEFIGFCFNVGHANLHNNSDELMKHNSRLKALRLHDNKGMTDDHQPLFWGTIDWPRVMRQIGQSSYIKPVNFEITHRPKCFEGATEEYLDCAVKFILRTL